MITAVRTGHIATWHETAGERMSGIKIGDIVARKSYGCDVFFKGDGHKGKGTAKGYLLSRASATGSRSDVSRKSRTLRSSRR